MAEREFQKALAEFRGVLAANPDHAEANFQTGRILLEAFQATDAIAWLSKAAEHAPRAAQVWQAWAEAVALGGAPEHRTAFVSALKKAEIKPELRVQLQDRFGARRKSSRPSMGGVSKKTVGALLKGLNSGAYKSVEAQSMKALAANPKSAILTFILGEAQAKQGKSEAAFANYRKAVSLDPQYAEAYTGMGKLLSSEGQPNKAANAFRPAVILTPDALAALIGLAQALSHRGNYRATITLLERVTRLEPRDAHFKVGLADAWKRQGEYPRAIALYQEALALYGKGKAPVDLQLALIDSQSQTGQDAEALVGIDAFLDNAPDHADALIIKGSILQTQGNFAAADQIFRQAIKAEPTNGEAYRRLLTGAKVEDGDPLVGEMARQYDKPGLGDRDRMNLGFALGKALDDTRQDERVFPYLNEANRIAASISAMSERQLFTEIVSDRDVFGAIDFNAVPEAIDNTFEPIFVTGLPRSGTTLVEQIIAAHSTVESGGELGYAKPLCRDMRTAQPGGSDAADSLIALQNVGRKYTEAVQQRFPGVTRLTDKSIYTFLAIGPLKRALPKAKFIVVRRDPRDNLLSIYKNKFPEGTHGYANNLESLARYYDEFDRTIAFWRERIPDWFYEVSYDALVSNPEPEAKKLIAACGLDWEDGCLEFHQKKNKVQTLSVFQVRQPINTSSVKGWRRFEADLKPMLDQLRKDGHVTD